MGKFLGPADAHGGGEGDVNISNDVAFRYVGECFVSELFSGCYDLGVFSPIVSRGYRTKQRTVMHITNFRLRIIQKSFLSV